MTIFGIGRDQLQHIASDADMGQRRAKAAMDQNPQYGDDYIQLSSYIYLVQLGLGMAVRDDPGDEPPVPKELIEIPHAVSLQDRGLLSWAWKEMPGFETKRSGGSMFEPPQTIVSIGVIPVYEGHTHDHRSINSSIYQHKDAFVRALVDHEQRRDRFLEQQRIENANAFIEHVARELLEGDDIELNPVFIQA